MPLDRPYHTGQQQRDGCDFQRARHARVVDESVEQGEERLEDDQLAR
jgi:hypothetical protein